MPLRSQNKDIDKYEYIIIEDHVGIKINRMDEKGFEAIRAKSYWSNLYQGRF